MSFNPDEAFDNTAVTEGVSWLRYPGKHLVSLKKAETWEDEKTGARKMSITFAIEKSGNDAVQVGEQYKQSWNFSKVMFDELKDAQRAKGFICALARQGTPTDVKMTDVKAVCGEDQPFTDRLVWCEAVKSSKSDFVDLRFRHYIEQK